MILTLSPNIPIKGVFQVDELLGGLKRTPRMCVTIASTRYDQKVDGKLSYLQLRTAPQSSDQSFENSSNKALKVAFSSMILFCPLITT